MAAGSHRHGNIVRYYDECEDDYRLVWDLDASLSMHMGYWDWSTWRLRGALERHQEVVAEFGRVRRGDTVLDAGCGVGGSAIHLAKKLGCHVTGITLASAQVERARANAARHDVAERTRFEVMDYSHTSFPDESFDVVWAIESTCYAPDREVFAREVHRLLKPGGRLVISDGFTLEAQHTGEEQEILDRWLHAWEIERIPSVHEMRLVLDRAGLEHIRFADITRNILPSARLLYASSVMAQPIGRALEILGLRSRARQRNITGGIYQYHGWTRSLAVYGLFAARKPLHPVPTSAARTRPAPKPRAVPTKRKFR